MDEGSLQRATILDAVAKPTAVGDRFPETEKLVLNISYALGVVKLGGTWTEDVSHDRRQDARHLAEAVLP